MGGDFHQTGNDFAPAERDTQNAYLLKETVFEKAIIERQFN